MLELGASPTPSPSFPLGGCCDLAAWRSPLRPRRGQAVRRWPGSVSRARCRCEDAAVSSDPPTAWFFIDVDGVLNAVGEVPQGDRRLVVQVENSEGLFAIRYDPRVVDRLNALTRDGLVQLIWLTTWARAARDSLAPAIGLDPGGRVLADLAAPDLARHPYDPHRPWWKLALLLGVIEDDPDRPVVWVDDDLDVATKERFPDLHPGRSLLVTPDPGVGLTLEDLDRVEAFCTARR